MTYDFIHITFSMAAPLIAAIAAPVAAALVYVIKTTD